MSVEADSRRASYDRTRLPIVEPDHEHGPLRRMGRFEWEKVILRTRFKQSSVKLVALALATYATPGTGANVRPGISRLITVTGLGDSQVRRNMKALERAGLLSMVSSGSSYGRGGKGAASDYVLTVPEALAEEFERERNAGTWDELNEWEESAPIDHRSPSTGDVPVDNSDHRPSSTGDNARSTPQIERTPVLGEETPVLGDGNTGTPVPPMSPRPHQLTPHHKERRKSPIEGTLTDRANLFSKDSAESIEDERNRQLKALEALIGA